MSIEDVIAESIRTATIESTREAQAMLHKTIKEIAERLNDSKYDVNALLTEEQVAEYLNVSVKTLRQWRSDKLYLTYSKVGNAPRYKFVDILEFVNKNKIRVTGGLI